MVRLQTILWPCPILVVLLERWTLDTMFSGLLSQFPDQHLRDRGWDFSKVCRKERKITDLSKKLCIKWGKMDVLKNTFSTVLNSLQWLNRHFRALALFEVASAEPVFLRNRTSLTEGRGMLGFHHLLCFQHKFFLIWIYKSRYYDRMVVWTKRTKSILFDFKAQSDFCPEKM